MSAKATTVLLTAALVSGAADGAGSMAPTGLFGSAGRGIHIYSEAHSDRTGDFTRAVTLCHILGPQEIHIAVHPSARVHDRSIGRRHEYITEWTGGKLTLSVPPRFDEDVMLYGKIESRQAAELHRIEPHESNCLKFASLENEPAQRAPQDPPERFETLHDPRRPLIGHWAGTLGKWLPERSEQESELIQSRIALSISEMADTSVVGVICTYDPPNPPPRDVDRNTLYWRYTGNWPFHESSGLTIHSAEDADLTTWADDPRIVITTGTQRGRYFVPMSRTWHIHIDGEGHDMFLAMEWASSTGNRLQRPTAQLRQYQRGLTGTLFANLHRTQEPESCLRLVEPLLNPLTISEGPDTETTPTSWIRRFRKWLTE